MYNVSQDNFVMITFTYLADAFIQTSQAIFHKSKQCVQCVKVNIKFKVERYTGEFPYVH